MIKGGTGGGNTITGLIFEGKTDLATFLSKQKGYFVDKEKRVFYNEVEVGQIFKKYDFYKFLEILDINWEKIISKRILPDNAIYISSKKTFFVIECKFQQVPGSVDEKLETCGFKKGQYQRLLDQAGIKVEYIYILSKWFKHPKYEDVRNYIVNVGCQFYFEYIPLSKLGLPVPDLS